LFSINYFFVLVPAGSNNGDAADDITRRLSPSSIIHVKFDGFDF